MPDLHEARGIEIVDCIRDEPIAGKSDVADRPGLLAALAALLDGNAGVLPVARLDRLARHLTVERPRDGRRAKATAGGKASGSYPFGWPLRVGTGISL